MSFDRLAPHYNWLEAILAGSLLQKCRTAWIDELAGCERLLVAGVGHGPELPAILQQFPRLRITCVDASAGMLAVAQRRLRKTEADVSRLEFVQARFPEWAPPTGHFDAVVTHFFLDCFPPGSLGAVIDGLTRATRPGARWLLADFTLPAHGWPRHRARFVHALMYAFFRRFAALPARRFTPPDPWLTARGFQLMQRRSYSHGLLYTDLWRRMD